MSNKTDIRRARISCYLDDNPDVDMGDIKAISDDLGIPYETVQNDIKILKAKLKETYKQYNLEGLIKKGLHKVNRLNELILKTREISDDSNSDPDMVLKAISLEAGLLNNLYHLEHDGVGIMTMKIKDRENSNNNNGSSDNSKNNELKDQSS